jgi:mannose-6-phosphate isomerase-like protein (cupin superfamily)
MSDFQSSIDLSLCPWPEPIKENFRRQEGNACVGTVLAAESERARVWHLSLPPGGRLPFHTHVLDYFWTCVSGGRARSHVAIDGRFEIADFDLKAGSTKFENFAAGAFKIHDLENTGDIDLVFVTVEFLQSSNRPLPIPETVRMTRHEGALQPA